MPIQTINIGSAPNDGTGDPVRDAFSKVNSNFNQVLPLSGGSLTGALTLNSDPGSALGAATKQYVDAVASGLDPKASCRLATTTNHGLSGLSDIDGVTPNVGDRILVKNQSLASENGIYVAASGSWSRAGDADEDSDITAGLHCLVTEGTSHGKQGFILTTNDPITVGTTPLTFEQYSDISGTPTATESVLGGLEVGTQAEVDAGSLDDKIVTPQKLENWQGSNNLTTLGAVSTITSLNMGDNQIIRPEIKDYAETLVTANTGSSYSINLVNGNFFELTLTANCTFSFSNPPASGKGGGFSLILKQDGTGSRTATWPGSVQWAGGTEPTLTNTASAVDILTFVTTDGGSSWYGFLGGTDFS